MVMPGEFPMIEPHR